MKKVHKDGENVENIRMMREAKGITQQEMATALNIDRSTVAKWELSRAFPRAEMLPAIARLLECKIDDLYGGEGG